VLSQLLSAPANVLPHLKVVPGSGEGDGVGVGSEGSPEQSETSR